MSEVARYQNDGTERVPPSRFIERAEDYNGQWRAELDSALSKFATSGDRTVLDELAKKIALDISAMCDRIKTGRLKGSFKGVVE